MSPALLLAAACLLVLLAAVAIGPQTGDLVLRRWHHEYLGQLLIGAGLGLLKLGAPDWLPLLLVFLWTFVLAVLVMVGLYLAADDAYQHARQRWCGEPDYRSPGHNLLGLFWGWAWVRRLAAWLDGLMGAGGNVP